MVMFVSSTPDVDSLLCSVSKKQIMNPMSFYVKKKICCILCLLLTHHYWVSGYLQLGIYKVNTSFSLLQENHWFAGEVQNIILAFLKTVPYEIVHHLSPGLVVVQVHEAPGIFLDFPGIHKAPWELNPVLDVGRTATPFPPCFLVVVVALLLTITTTLTQVALAAGCGDGMRHTCRCDGIGERRLPATCGSECGVWERGEGKIKSYKKKTFRCQVRKSATQKTKSCEMHFFLQWWRFQIITCLALWLQPPAKMFDYNSLTGVCCSQV